MLREKTKEAIIKDVNDAKSLEEVKGALLRLVEHMPTQESVAKNIVNIVNNASKLC